MECRVDTLLDQGQSNKVELIFGSTMLYRRHALPECTTRRQIAVDPTNTPEGREVTATSVLVETSASAKLRFGLRDAFGQLGKVEHDGDREMNLGE
jgi:hypothetical protein